MRPSGTPSSVPQCFPCLLNDWIIGTLVPVEIVDGGSRQVRTPLATDPRGVFENRGQELVFMAVIACLAAQPAMGRLHEQGHGIGPPDRRCESPLETARRLSPLKAASHAIDSSWSRESLPGAA